MTDHAALPPAPPGAPAFPPVPDDGMKLHIGGEVRVPGWTVINVNPGPHVDIVGSCTDLHMIESASCAVIYASHVMEHLGYDRDLPHTLRECHRILKPGGRLLISVPDLDLLCRMFIDPNSNLDDRIYIMRVMYGGRIDPYDVHVTGLSVDILGSFLKAAGFAGGYRVADFGLFDDGSKLSYCGVPLSLNLVSIKT